MPSTPTATDPAAVSGGPRRSARLGPREERPAPPEAGREPRARLIHLAPAELLGLLVCAGLLNLWSLDRNGWANGYYSAAARSMSSSWHDFLFASLDPAGVMSVDKPPLGVWVQAASVRLFGFHPLSVLVPQALMGMATVLLVHNLVRRRFGRVGGFVAGLAAAVTPALVAVSRHNNPDALLMLCSVAALWCAVRGLESGRTRWLLACGVCVGLGFETKMGVALTVVPGIAAAWLWVDPRGRGRLPALRQLLGGGAAMLLVGGAWPLLVELTPAADRPWVAGTSDNTVLSLIFGYNGLSRVGGQAGVPSSAGGLLSGGPPGPLRLLNSPLGGQVGWLLGFVLLGGLAIVLACRLRRGDGRTGWVIVVGGAFAVTAGLFSAAGGIFHPYYVSLLAPFAAALVGAGFAELSGRSMPARILAPLAVAAGVTSELIVAARYPGRLLWLAPLAIVVGALVGLALAVVRAPRLRIAALGAATAVLLVGPAIWALDTLGYPASGTFPAGGPDAVVLAALQPHAVRRGRRPSGLPGAAARAPGAPRRFSRGVSPPDLGAGVGVGGQAAPLLGLGGLSAGGASPPSAPFAGAWPPVAPVSHGGPFGDDRAIRAFLGYVRSHGGGTIAVSSQSSAAAAIIATNADVAGIGGFSGRESEVGLSWLAQEIRDDRIRWVISEPAAGIRGGAAGDSRVGARTAMAAVAVACLRTNATPSGPGRLAAATSVLYDCRGRAALLLGTRSV